MCLVAVRVAVSLCLTQSSPVYAAMRPAPIDAHGQPGNGRSGLIIRWFGVRPLASTAGTWTTRWPTRPSGCWLRTTWTTAGVGDVDERDNDPDQHNKDYLGGTDRGGG
jgi:hypothetical protein